jgi:hypothetical protein
MIRSPLPRTTRRLRALLFATAVAVTVTGFGGCSSQPAVPNLGPGTFSIAITSVDGSTTLPTVANPLPPNHGTTNETWGFTIEAHSPTGELATDFNGYVRLTLEPGTVAAVTSTTNTTMGINILLKGGQAAGVVQGTAVYGPARLWVEDLGYVPAPPGVTPQCSNGIDDNNNGLIDYPADPGCYFADDNTENGGTYASGVSPPVQYALPLIADARGAFPGPGGGLIGGARTPYPNEAINLAASDPEFLVVTSVASNGFYVTDVGANAVANGYNSIFAYSFSTPANMEVCDRITALAGTTNDFYGFTQLSFPEYTNTYVILGQDGGTFDADGGIVGCRVPEPTVLAPSFFGTNKNATAAALFKYESGLVRLEGFTIAKWFGPGLAFQQDFRPGYSNCDFNGDGSIDYTQINCTGPTPCEGDCANACDNNVDCTEWTAYAARSAFKVSYQGNPTTMIQIDATTVSTFDPVGSAGLTIPYFTGSLTEFSGGNLNWTVAVRCPDDLVCPAALGCSTQQPIPSTVACVRPRTVSDNDEGSN